MFTGAEKLLGGDQPVSNGAVGGYVYAKLKFFADHHIQQRFRLCYRVYCVKLQYHCGKIQPALEPVNLFCHGIFQQFRRVFNSKYAGVNTYLWGRGEKYEGGSVIDGALTQLR